LLIRSRIGLTAEERAWFDQHGLHVNSDTNAVTWTPPPGVSGDLKTERGYLLNAYDLLTGPTEPITAEELAEALASGEALESLLAEFDRLHANSGGVHDK
jgi:hypothetical protein